MQPLKVTIVPVTPFQQNCSIVACSATNRAAIVDPGGDVARIRAAIDQLAVTPEKILLTHGHLDHAGGAAELAAALALPIEGPDQRDEFLLSNLEAQGARFGIGDMRNVTPTRWLTEGETVSIGDLTFSVLHVPGHTPGHLVFVNAPARFALVGDTLFQGSVGRTDFPYGNHAQLIGGIKEKLLPLGDDVTILPGHGPASTIGAERRGNGFLVN
ncbi:MAG TPA: MBL fold metallo-hydrolase [Xanthobacteraceae bacterium]|nr:MBL fold metallo-hydrolase [Xanthobacteraceae bacterium]